MPRVGTIRVADRNGESVRAFAAAVESRLAGVPRSEMSGACSATSRSSRIPAGAGTTVNLKLPSYDLVNLSAGLEFDSGLDLILYANNIFNENPLLSFDRERGGRARLGFNVGNPRIIGLTVYQWDIHLRQSTIIGIVGAGGIGTTLYNSFTRYDYDFSLAILLVIIAIVAAGEWVSAWARGRIQ